MCSSNTVQPNRPYVMPSALSILPAVLPEQPISEASSDIVVHSPEPAAGGRCLPGDPLPAEACAGRHRQKGRLHPASAGHLLAISHAPEHFIFKAIYEELELSDLGTSHPLVLHHLRQIDRYVSTFCSEIPTSPTPQSIDRLTRAFCARHFNSATGLNNLIFHPLIRETLD